MYQRGPHRGLDLIIFIKKLVVAEILEDRVQLDLEPRLEHREVSALWPCCLVSVPPIQFVLEYCGMYLFENLPRFLVVVVAWDQVDSLLIVRIGHEPRVIQPRRPIEVGLLRPYDDRSAVEHRCTLPEA